MVSHIEDYDIFDMFLSGNQEAGHELTALTYFVCNLAAKILFA